jgi:hypothetical protein
MCGFERRQSSLLCDGAAPVIRVGHQNPERALPETRTKSCKKGGRAPNVN